MNAIITVKLSIKKANSIPKTLYEAFKIAQTPRCGPVHINLPRDILAKNCAFNISEKIYSTYNIFYFYTVFFRFF